MRRNLSISRKLSKTLADTYWRNNKYEKIVRLRYFSGQDETYEPLRRVLLQDC